MVGYLDIAYILSVGVEIAHLGLLVGVSISEWLYRVFLPIVRESIAVGICLYDYGRWIRAFSS